MSWIFMKNIVVCISTCRVSVHAIISLFLLACSNLSFNPSLRAKYVFLVCRIRCGFIFLILIRCFSAKLASVCFLCSSSPSSLLALLNRLQWAENEQCAKHLIYMWAEQYVVYDWIRLYAHCDTTRRNFLSAILRNADKRVLF